jgi:ferric-dicitrate binding protein FerR (iron transport regulator)
MDKQKFLDLIEKFKRGECSPQEKELLENYLESFQDKRGEWNENQMGNQTIIEGKIYSKILKSIYKEKTYDSSRIFFTPSLLKMAASIIFFLVLVSGILYVSGVFEQKTDSVVWHEKVTSSGEISVLTFSDGSKVTLNADSKLRYPEHFDGANKEVYLKGEAYFEVHHNIDHPFIVHAANLTTTDLGTKFDISAYPENKTIAVSLLEGKVKVSKSKKEKMDNIVVLKPREQLVYDKENNVSSFDMVDSLEAIGWKDNIYKFENQPLGEVLSQLERAFGVKFILNNQSVLAQKITVKFEKNSLQTVAEVVKSLTGLDFKIVKGGNNKKEVLFFRNN